MIYAKKYGLEIWAYCLMRNHLHLIGVPKYPNSLARCLAETHKKYSAYINKKHGWKGYLWQGRFISYPMDETYLYAAVRYVETNPVKAKIVEKAEDYRWSSAYSHVNKKKNPLLTENFLTEEIKNWGDFLLDKQSEIDRTIFQKHEKCREPLGNDEFIEMANKTRKKR